jgi:hypothetical protein
MVDLCSKTAKAGEIKYRLAHARQMGRNRIFIHSENCIQVYDDNMNSILTMHCSGCATPLSEDVIAYSEENTIIVFSLAYGAIFKFMVEQPPTILSLLDKGILIIQMATKFLVYDLKFERFIHKNLAQFVIEAGSVVTLRDCLYTNGQLLQICRDRVTTTSLPKLQENTHKTICQHKDNVFLTSQYSMNGGTQLHLCTCHDLTTHKRLESQLKKLDPGFGSIRRVIEDGDGWIVVNRMYKPGLFGISVNTVYDYYRVTIEDGDMISRVIKEDTYWCEVISLHNRGDVVTWNAHFNWRESVRKDIRFVDCKLVVS